MPKKDLDNFKKNLKKANQTEYKRVAQKVAPPKSVDLSKLKKGETTEAKKIGGAQIFINQKRSNQDNAGIAFLKKPSKKMNIADIGNALQRSCEVVAKLILDFSKVKKWDHVGCTFAASAVYQNHVFSCSIGDSNSIVVNPYERTLQNLVRIYLPIHADEKKRIEKSQNGKVFLDKNNRDWRMGGKNLDGSLLMSRSLGDDYYHKMKIGHSYNTDITYTATEENDVLVVFSDGVIGSSSACLSYNHIIEILRINPEYAAEIIACHPDNGSSDDRAVVIIPVKIAKHTPIMGIVADGHGHDKNKQLPNEIAAAAIKLVSFAMDLLLKNPELTDAALEEKLKNKINKIAANPNSYIHTYQSKSAVIQEEITTENSQRLQRLVTWHQQIESLYALHSNCTGIEEMYRAISITEKSNSHRVVYYEYQTDPNSAEQLETELIRIGQKGLGRTTESNLKFFCIPLKSRPKAVDDFYRKVHGSDEQEEQPAMEHSLKPI